MRPTATTTSLRRLLLGPAAGPRSVGLPERASLVYDHSPKRTRRGYTVAVCRQVSPRMQDALSQHSVDPEPFDLDKARQEHAHYVATLRRFLPVLELPASPDLADSVFVEDTVVAEGKHAVLTRPGHVSRQPEVQAMGTMLQQFGMTVSTMPQEALCDGGDVLYWQPSSKDKNAHLFVGLSDRTNQAAVDALQEALPDTRVHAIPLADAPKGDGATSVLHLKSAVTLLDARTALAPIGPLGDFVVAHMTAAIMDSQEDALEWIRLDDPLACNVVSLVVGPTKKSIVLAQPTTPSAQRLLQEAADERGLTMHWVPAPELAKKDAALTCCSVLLDL